MIVGILFDTPDDYPHALGPSDRFAEFEPDSTIQIMEEAIRLIGAKPLRIGAPKELLSGKPDIDLIWNIAEGYGTRNREAWGPVLAEMRGIPCIGSDALTLGISLDKHRTKQLAQIAGVPTAPWMLYPPDNPSLSLNPHLDLPSAPAPVPASWFPAFAKPRYEGTAKGIGPWSRCSSSEELRVLAARLWTDYGQDVLVEPWLPGAEYTVALIGAPLEVQPVLERALHRPTSIGIHAVAAHDPAADSHAFTHDHIPPDLEQRLRQWSLDLCRELEVRHFARLDFKCDADGNPFFLEINPHPTFAGDNTFGILAEIAGKTPSEFLAGYLEGIVGNLTRS